MAEEKDIAKPEHVGLDSQPKHVQDKVDLAHEIMGEGSNRIRRFLSNDGSNFHGESKEKKSERKYHSMLQMLLAEDAQYAQLYFEVEQSLEQAQRAVDEAMIALRQELEEINNTLLNADEHGLSEEQRKVLQLRKEEIERQQLEIEGYSRDVLEHARTRLYDENDPALYEELKELQERIEQNMPDYVSAFHDVNSYSNTAASSAHVTNTGSPVFDIPDLTTTFTEVQHKLVSTTTEPNLDANTPSNVKLTTPNI